MSTVLPCQVLWLNNKVKDWKDGQRRYSPCVLEDGKRLICIQQKEGVPSDKEVMNVILAGCQQYCPYGMDEEKILADRNAYIVIEGSENQLDATDDPSIGTSVEP